MSEHLFEPSSSEQITATMRAEMQRSVGPAANDIIGELAAMFVSDIPQLIEEAAVAFRDQQMVRLKEIAHTLKGSSSSIGIRRFAQLCAELEELAAVDRPAETAILIEHIRAEFDAVKQALQLFTTNN